ncbi:MAG: DUF721 domain-containing protein [Actinomycetes bacterium]
MSETDDPAPHPTPSPNDEAVAPQPSPADGLALARQALSAARGSAGPVDPRRGGRPRGSAPDGDAGAGVPGTFRRRRRRVVLDEDEIPFSGARPDARDPQAVESVVARLRAEHGWTKPLAGGEVVGRWQEIVGAEVAAHVAAESVDGDVLTVRADSSAWASQVRLLVPTLLARISEAVGPGVVASVVVRGPAAPSWRKGGLHVRGRGPRDTYG